MTAVVEDFEIELPDLTSVTSWDELTPEEQAEAEAEMMAEEFGTAAPTPKAKVTHAQRALVHKHRMMTVATLLQLPPTEWMLEGLLPVAGRTVIYGAGGSRKSFLVLDWMLCASLGRPWQGREVRRGKVLYILGEGVSGMGKRLRAWCEHNDVDAEALTQIDFMAQPINLWALKPEQVANWAALIEELEYDYIVIDTLHTAMSGGEESSAKDIGIVYDNAQQLAGTAALIFVHHDTKTGKSGGRGSSSLRDDADVVISMEAVDEPLVSRLAGDKLRDADTFDPMDIQFEVIGEGIDSSLVVSGVGDKRNGRVGSTAAARIAEVITALGLDPHTGIDRLTDQLRSNGYPTSKTTVTTAVRALRNPTVITFIED